MAQRNRPKQKRADAAKKQLVGAALLGAGLLLIGLAAILIIPKAQPQAAVPQDTGSSVVPMEVNYPAPVVELTDTQGNPVALSDYQGKVVLINLWATWCPPCKAEMPTLQAYFDEHQAEGFMLVAINDGDPEADVLSFVQERNLTFPVWLDPQYYASEQAFKTNSLPSSFVIDGDGVVRLAWTGAISRDALEQYVTPLLGN